MFNFRKNISIASLSVMLSTISLSANASLVNVDYLNKNDNLVVYDTETSLHWLKLSETAGLSFNNVYTAMNDGGQLEGFRYATEEEVYSIMDDFVPDIRTFVQNPAYARSFSNTEGIRFNNTFGQITTSLTYTYGDFFIERNGVTLGALTGIASQINNSGNWLLFNNHVPYYLQNLDFAHPVHSHWLVSQGHPSEIDYVNGASNVDVPLTGLLFTLSIGLLTASRSKKA